MAMSAGLEAGSKAQLLLIDVSSAPTGMRVKLRPMPAECRRHGIAKPRVEEHAKRALEPWVTVDVGFEP